MLAELGGPPASGDYGQFAVAGTANLNSGTLDVSLINGFDPTSPKSFAILVSSGLLGTFSTVDLPGPGWSVECNSPSPGFGEVVVDFTPSPTLEPSSAILLGIAIAKILGGGWRSGSWRALDVVAKLRGYAMAVDVAPRFVLRSQFNGARHGVISRVSGSGRQSGDPRKRRNEAGQGVGGGHRAC